MRIFPRLLAAAFFCLSLAATGSEVFTWSTTSDNNNATPPNGWPEGMQYSQVNNAAREMMGAIARQSVDLTDASVAGSANAYTISPSRTIASYTSGLEFAFIAPFTNTGAATMKIGMLSAVNLLDQDGNELPAGAITENARYHIRYISNAFRVMTPIILNSTNSTDTTKAASAAAVKEAFDIASGAASLAKTGDIKLTIKTTADMGWIIMNDGSIGDSSSGATTRANDDTKPLYVLICTNISNTYAPMSGGRGASCESDFAAHKALMLPRVLGRALAVGGTGSGLSARALGQYMGEENHILSINEMPSHQHDSAWGSDNATPPYGLSTSGPRVGSGDTDYNNPGWLTGPAGGGAAHNNMQPTTFLNVMIKL